MANVLLIYSFTLVPLLPLPSRLPDGKCKDCGVSIPPDSEVMAVISSLCVVCDSLPHLQVYPDKAARREIDSLDVYCPNRPTGCEWTGTLASVEAHVCQCAHKGVTCPNEGCGLATSSAKLELHLKECPFRHVECEFCHSKLPHHLLSVSIE